MNSEMQKKIRSSAACRRRLDDLYRPILDRIVNGEFNEEGGSDAYDRAIAELKEAYLATPNLGCMINEAWKIFIDSNTLAPVEMVDLDEADLTTTQQGASLVEKVGLGESKEAERAMAQPSQQANLFQELCGGRNLGDCRRPDGRLDLKAIRRMMEDDFIQAADNPELRSELSQDLKEDNMDTEQKKSSAACSARIHELFQPIKEREDSDVYKGEGGHTLYQQHILEAQQAYLDTPKLGVMKWREMENHLSLLSDRSIVNMDISATDIAKKKQEKIVRLVLKMAELIQEFRKTFQEFVDNRSDLINWLSAKAISLDEKQKQANTDMFIATSVSATSSAAGIAVLALALAPVTFGASLALGFGFGAATVGIASGAANFKLRLEKRKYDLNAHDEAKKLLEKDEELAQKMDDINDKLLSHGKNVLQELEIRKEIRNARFGKKETPLVPPSTCTPEITNTADADDLLNDLLVNASKMGIQVADDVLEVAQGMIFASKAVGDVAAVFGVCSLVWDTLILVQTRKDMTEGSKSKLGAKLREAGQILENNLRQIIKVSESAEKFVDFADARLGPLMKRYPLTFRNAELNDD